MTDSPYFVRPVCPVTALGQVREGADAIFATTLTRIESDPAAFSDPAIARNVRVLLDHSTYRRATIATIRSAKPSIATVVVLPALWR